MFEMWYKRFMPFKTVQESESTHGYVDDDANDDFQYDDTGKSLLKILILAYTPDKSYIAMDSMDSQLCINVHDSDETHDFTTLVLFSTISLNLVYLCLMLGTLMCMMLDFECVFCWEFYCICCWILNVYYVGILLYLMLDYECVFCWDFHVFVVGFRMFVLLGNS
ncbi:unnamed protein product [Amaranthus hypochondriacus]